MKNIMCWHCWTYAVGLIVAVLNYWLAETTPLPIVAWTSWLCAVGVMVLLAALFITNAIAGCYPWSPKVVDYHDDMKICPGQSVRIDIDLNEKH